VEPEQNEKLDDLSRKIASLYIKVKEYVIVSEKLSLGARVSVAALNELRNAFDHCMRVDAARHGLTKPGDGAEQHSFTYREKNLQKALGHVYRAGYDALDILAISKIREIETYVDSYRISTRYRVIPDYTNCVKIPFDEARRQCDDAKKGKDVEPEEINQHPAFFEEYEKALEVFMAILGIFQRYRPGLDDVEKAAREHDAAEVQKFRRQRNWALVGIAVAVALAAVGILVTVWLSRAPAS
jgi:hypothetical protein